MSDPEGPPGAPAAERRAILGLRLGLGIVWAVNLLFIVLPQANFFGTFSATAASYEGSTLGGGGLPAWVAAHPAPFSVAVAVVTAYLAVAFLTGRTVRIACLVGSGFAVALLITQWATTFAVPGGTDVGPQPLYIVAYAALALAGPAMPRKTPAVGESSAPQSAPDPATVRHPRAALSRP